MFAVLVYVEKSSIRNGVPLEEGGGGGAGGVLPTVTVALPAFPPLVATTDVVPTPTAVTWPPALTVATALLLLDHTVVCPVSPWPSESRAVAVHSCDPPTTSDTVDGATETADTGEGAGGGAGGVVTAIVADPVFPPLVAVIVTPPAATPETTPLAVQTPGSN